MSHPFAISDRLIDDTVTTALEGGITYWAVEAAPSHWPARHAGLYASEVLTRGADLIITLDPELETEPQRLTRAKMVQGIRAYCAQRKITPAYLEDDPPDASGADAIVQLALFGEVIYG